VGFICPSSSPSDMDGYHASTLFRDRAHRQLISAQFLAIILTRLIPRAKELRSVVTCTIQLLRCSLFVAFALFGGLTSAAQGRKAGTGALLPLGSVFNSPPPNACASPYDQFYASEPGVYADWALCESGIPRQFYDYVGDFDLTPAAHAFGSGPISTVPGPLPDGESAAHVATATSWIASQDLPLNPHEGSIALWISADATPYPVTGLFLAPLGHSPVRISLGIAPGLRGETTPDLCFEAVYSTSSTAPLSLHRCHYLSDTWHRLVFTWKAPTHAEGLVALTLFVDGEAVAAGSAPAQIDNTLYVFRLFPGCCDTRRSMSLASVLIANQAWTPEQVRRDYQPDLPHIPSGGVLVTTRRLGIVHRDLLGVADFGQDISTPERRTALLTGLRAAGITTLRYAGGYGGIQADLVDWKTGAICPPLPGHPGASAHAFSDNNLDHFASSILGKMPLDVVYTVNYGTNPPACNAGGDPSSAAALVRHANNQQHLGIHHWEIGNELFSSATETDLHPDPNSGSSYAQYEPAFYRAIHADDPNAQIAVPVGGSTYGWQSGFDLPVLAHAVFDDIVWHNYPLIDPISDGSTLYYDRVAAHVHRVRGTLLKLRTELLASGHPPDAIWITEWDGEPGGNRWSRQTVGAAAPLFAASQLGEYMRAGVRLATWWTQGYPAICSSYNYDPTGNTAYSWYNCGAAALVYTGAVAARGEVPTGMRPGDLLPAARAFQLLSESDMVREGERSLATLTDPHGAPWLLAFAATHGAGVAVLLINRDRDQTHTVPIAIEGRTRGALVEQWSWGRAQYDRSRNGDWSAAPVHSTLGPWSRDCTATLPPWSIAVVIFE